MLIHVCTSHLKLSHKGHIYFHWEKFKMWYQIFLLHSIIEDSIFQIQLSSTDPFQTVILPLTQKTFICATEYLNTFETDESIIVEYTEKTMLMLPLTVTS